MQLVLITISDHYTRTRANSNAEAGPATTVMGALLGQQTGRVVDISNCFEISFTDQPSGWHMNEAFFQRKQDQCVHFSALPCRLPGQAPGSC